MITNDLTLENINLRAQIAKLTAPPSEGEIEEVARVIENSIMKARIWHDGDTPNWLEAKAAITKFLELRGI